MARPRIWLLVALAGACRPSSPAQPPVAEYTAATPSHEPDDGAAARDVDAPSHVDAPTITPGGVDPAPRTTGDDSTPPTETPPRRDAPPRSDAHDDIGPAASPDRFVRGSWASWIDADGDCQDTRAEVLIASSEVPVTFADKRQCKVATGQWRCPYTDRTITDPHQLDIDHLVPLAHVHAAGGSRWDEARWRSYSNELGDPDHLVAVDLSANRSKGSRTVAQWLPEEPGFRCQYVAAWRRIKHQWRLSESADERTVIDTALEVCGTGDVPTRPGKAPKQVAPRTDDAPSSCCRVCKSGKPCGDACISADKTCRKPPGCAC